MARRQADQALVASDGAASVSTLSGFDPSRGDAAIRTAVARRKELVRLLPAMTAELKRLDAFIDTWCDMAGVQRPARPPRKAGDYKNRINPPREFVAQACLDILAEVGRPLDRRAMLAALAERGISINGKDPSMTLSTMLWRSKDVITRTLDGYVPASGIETEGEDAQQLRAEHESPAPKGDAQ